MCDGLLPLNLLGDLALPKKLTMKNGISGLKRRISHLNPHYNKQPRMPKRGCLLCLG